MLPLNGMGFWLMEKMEEKGEWFERCGSQSTHTCRVTIGKMRNVLKVTPTLVFIAIYEFFRVLSPWSRL